MLFCVSCVPVSVCSKNASTQDVATSNVLAGLTDLGMLSTMSPMAAAAGAGAGNTAQSPAQMLGGRALSRSGDGFESDDFSEERGV